MTNQSTKKNTLITKLDKEQSHIYEKTIELNDNAKIVLEKRYLRKDSEGNIIETPSQMFLRVAKAIAKPET